MVYLLSGAEDSFEHELANIKFSASTCQPRVLANQVHLQNLVSKFQKKAKNICELLEI